MYTCLESSIEAGFQNVRRLCSGSTGAPAVMARTSIVMLCVCPQAAWAAGRGDSPSLFVLFYLYLFLGIIVLCIISNIPRVLSWAFDLCRRLLAPSSWAKECLESYTTLERKELAITLLKRKGISKSNVARHVIGRLEDYQGCTPRERDDKSDAMYHTLGVIGPVIPETRFVLASAAMKDNSSALAALAEIHPAHAVKILRRKLNRSDIDDRIWCLSHLYLISDREETIAMLSKAFNDDAKEVRTKARDWLLFNFNRVAGYGDLPVSWLKITMGKDILFKDTVEECCKKNSKETMDLLLYMLRTEVLHIASALATGGIKSSDDEDDMYGYYTRRLQNLTTAIKKVGDETILQELETIEAMLPTWVMETNNALVKTLNPFGCMMTDLNLHVRRSGKQYHCGKHCE